MSWVVLVGGGHAAGKRTLSEDLKKKILESPLASKLQVVLINMSQYQQEVGTPSVDFARLLSDLKKYDGGKLPTLTVVHGNYALYDRELRSTATMKVFLDIDADDRLSQWIRRDVGPDISLSDLLQRYLKESRHEYSKYIEETRKFADVLLPRGSDQQSIDVLTTGILDRVFSDSAEYGIQNSAQAGGTIDLRRELFDQQDHRYYSTV